MGCPLDSNRRADDRSRRETERGRRRLHSGAIQTALLPCQRPQHVSAKRASSRAGAPASPREGVIGSWMITSELLGICTSEVFVAGRAASESRIAVQDHAVGTPTPKFCASGAEVEEGSSGCAGRRRPVVNQPALPFPLSRLSSTGLTIYRRHSIGSRRSCKAGGREISPFAVHCRSGRVAAEAPAKHSSAPSPATAFPCIIA